MNLGAMLVGRYRLTGRLGQGGMGEVWSAVDEDLDRSVAIKIVSVRLAADSRLTARLRREAQLAAGLRHPGITVVHDIGEHAGQPFFVMELLEGTDLKTSLAEHPTGLPVRRVAGLMAQVADALAYAHRKGIVHRDIKPANLMELAEGGVKICDFGVSRLANATTDLTGPGAMLGTPAYMAPEQYTGAPVDGRTDLYSVGCTLYALLTGSRPFPGPSAAALLNQHLTVAPPSLSAARPDVPAALDHLVSRLLAKDPAHRPATGAEVGDVLRSITTPPPPRPAPPPPSTRPVSPPLPSTQPARPPSTQRRRLLLVAGLAVGAAAVPAGFLLFDQFRQEGPGGTGGRAGVGGRGSGTATTPALGPLNPSMGRSLSGHTDTVLSLAYRRDGQVLASGGKDKTVRLWDTASGRSRATFTGHTNWVRAVAYHPAGGLVASGGDDHTVRLWDAATGRAKAVFSGHARGVFAVAFSPDGKTLASGSQDETARLWDVATGTTRLTLPGHTSWVSALAFSPDGRLLATCADDQHVRLWDTATGRRARMFTGAANWVNALAFSPDGKILATCGDDNAVRLWKLDPLGVIFTLSGHTDTINEVAFNRDGRLLASCGNDDVVRLWDVAAGRSAAVLSGHTGDVETVAFHPDGKSLADGDGKEIRLWRVFDSP